MILDIQKEFRALAEQVRTAGLMERRPSRSGARIVLTFSALGGSWAALFLVGNSWSCLGVAVLLAITSTHVLFVGHDAGHQQLFRSSRANWLVGLVVGNLLTGLSFSWWVPKHNAHHAFPNQIGRDPDIGPGVFPVADDVGDGEPRPMGERVASRAFGLLCVLPLELGMHLTSAKGLAGRRGRAAEREWLLLAGHAALYLTVVFWVLSPLKAVVFIAVQQGLFGVYLRASFAPNHKGMPIIGADERVGYVERQVSTARNVVGGRVLAFALGGLNYQIEHHLFPTMRRANLRRAREFVRPFCARTGLDYREDRLSEAYRQAYRSLRGASEDIVEVSPAVPIGAPG